MSSLNIGVANTLHEIRMDNTAVLHTIHLPIQEKQRPSKEKLATQNRVGTCTLKNTAVMVVEVFQCF